MHSLPPGAALLGSALLTNAAAAPDLAHRPPVFALQARHALPSAVACTVYLDGYTLVVASAGCDTAAATVLVGAGSQRSGRGRLRHEVRATRRAAPAVDEDCAVVVAEG